MHNLKFVLRFNYFSVFINSLQNIVISIRAYISVIDKKVKCQVICQDVYFRYLSLFLEESIKNYDSF